MRFEFGVKCAAVCLLASAFLSASSPDARARQRRRPPPRPAQTGSAGAQATRQSQEIAELIQANRLAEAEALARRTVEASPRDSRARAMLAVVLDSLGRAEEAEREFHEALRLDPRDASAHANLGVLLARTNRAERAAEEFEAALRLAPDNRQAAFNLGAIYSARGDFVRAVPALERAAGVRAGVPAGAAGADPALLLLLVKSYLLGGRAADGARLAAAVERAASE
ncbi:MAG TPA: tetratricopeptide repeat protein, partial [Pyrinomonadaceae bacterium]|nr:tetratricopeptide repeat protein [Pyrinomonadaceae bacterium]